MESKRPIRTQNKIKKENEIFEDYNTLIKELSIKVKEVGFKTNGFSKGMICDKIGEKHNVSGRWVGMIITRKIKESKTRIE